MEIQELAEKLYQEGVAKGKTEADQIIANAKRQAEEILASAKSQAEKIVTQAKSDAEKQLENGKNNLRLAARDILLQLQLEISCVFEQILAQATASSFQQEDVVRQLLKLLLEAYLKNSTSEIAVELSSEMEGGLKTWLTEEIKVKVQQNRKLAGFFLKESSGGTIEVTADSVREAVLPYLRGLAKEIVAKEKIL